MAKLITCHRVVKCCAAKEEPAQRRETLLEALCLRHLRPHHHPGHDLSRRVSLGLAASAAVLVGLRVDAAQLSLTQQPQAGETEPALVVTQRAYLDVGLCPEGLRRNRAIGDKSALCSDPEQLGRIVIGLYGNLVPTTVANFVAAAQAGVYDGTIFHKVFKGEYIAAGRQGSKRIGEVEVPPGVLQSNQDTLSADAFRTPHLRAGTVSLRLGDNDDYAEVRQRRDYRNAQFLITTGPAPVPSLDGENIVFGRVLEGFETIGAITAVPTFLPNESARQMNQFATFIGDGRASKTRDKWGMPLKAVVITGAGVLPNSTA